MKILYLVPYAPTLIRTRPYNLARALNRAGQQVTLFTVWEDEGERQALARLEREGIQVRAFRLSRKQRLMNGVMGLAGGDALQAWYSWQPELCQAAMQALKAERWDLIQVEHLRGGIYVRKLADWIKKEKLPVRLIWDAVDSISSLFEQTQHQSRSGKSRLIAQFELPRTRKMEIELCNTADRVLVAGKHDRQAMLAAAHLESCPEKVQVLPNGVDLEYFQPGDGRGRAGDVILFSGKLSYHANASAALYLIKEIMPVIWKSKAQVRLQLVGKDPPQSLRSLAEAEARIAIAANVPDMRPYLQAATLAVAPILYGAGIQNKVLEALACGVPLVASPQAASGFEHIRNGVELIVADNPEDFAQGVLSLLENEGLRRSLSQAGIEFIRRWHDWDQIAGGYIADLERLMENG